MMPTAMSSMLPLTANSLNSLSIPPPSDPGSAPRPPHHGTSTVLTIVLLQKSHCTSAPTLARAVARTIAGPTPGDETGRPAFDCRSDQDLRTFVPGRGTQIGRVSTASRISTSTGYGVCVARLASSASAAWQSCWDPSRAWWRPRRRTSIWRWRSRYRPKTRFSPRRPRRFASSSHRSLRPPVRRCASWPPTRPASPRET